MTETPTQRAARLDAEETVRAWRSYNERLAAYLAGTLPMPPQKPVRYPFA